MSIDLPPVTSPPWSVTAKRLIALTVLTLLFLFARQVDAVAWYAIIVAVVLAYLLSPVVTFFERRLKLIPNRETRRSLSVLLTWLMVLSLVGIVPCFWGLQIPGLLGIIFGFIGLKQTKDNARKGRGMAIAGLVIGIILVVVAIALWVYILTSDNCVRNGSSFTCTSD